jgi:hypothetical protein
MAKRKHIVITTDDVPVLPPFISTPYDVSIILNDGSSEIIKVMARGPCMAMITALHSIGRWSPEKIAKLVSLTI